MNDNTTSSTPAGRRQPVTRRTVASGLAWSAPVVAVGAAAPLASATVCEPTITVNTKGACKCPGQSTTDPWGYYLNICATSDKKCPLPTGQTVTIVGVAGNQGDLTSAPLTPYCNTLPVTLTVDGDCSGILRFTGDNSGNFLSVRYLIGNSTVLHVDDKVPAPKNDCTFCGQPMGACP